MCLVLIQHPAGEEFTELTGITKTNIDPNANFTEIINYNMLIKMECKGNLGSFVI